MPIYERPTKSLMADWAKEKLSKGQVFEKTAAIHWFAQHYPKIKSNTVAMHVEGMSTNNTLRRHHPSIKPGSGHDLFFKLGPNQFRLWDKSVDPAPRYKDDLEVQPENSESITAKSEDATEAAEVASGEFAFERDLRNYLVRNLNVVEAGLQLYDDEGITGVEFPAGGRFIDILAVDKEGRYVVIELKVARGYDRVIGQLLRYMAWIEQNMENAKSVRGIIVASKITPDLKLASSRIPDIGLIEYEISFTLRTV